MTVNNNHRKLSQSAAFTLLYFSLFSASFTAAANVSQAPLSLSEGVPPNMIFTMDDSTSMNSAYTPDTIDGARDTRRGKSAHFNPSYYDPHTTYVIPPSFDQNNLDKSLSTSFAKAYYDGFSPNKNSGNDWADLSTSYKVSWNYNRNKNGIGSSYTDGDNSARDSILAPNPVIDFSCSVSGL